MKQRILIADDDPHIRDVLLFTLEEADYQVIAVENGSKAVTESQRQNVDLVILDIGMPDMDGLEACKAIRRQSQVPILFLTARDDEIDRVIGFELGGDDYVSKPFSPRELSLRVKAILKRLQYDCQDKNWQFGDLSVDADGHECRLVDKTLELTAKEFSVLEVLIRTPQKVFSRSDLIAQVYGQHFHLSDRTIDSHIRNIRNKAKSLGYEDIITTLHGVGVRLGGCKN